MTEYITIITTTNSEFNAKFIANSLIETKLAACVQLIPKVTSTFKWKNSINQEEEFLILIKTINTLKKDVQKIIEKNHTYETPEIISFSFDILNDNYKKWFDLSLGERIE